MSQPAQRTAPVSPYVALLFAIFFVSTSAVLIRFAQKDASSLVIAGYRLSIASLILIPVAWFTRKNEIKALKWPQIRLFILSGFFLALHFACWISSLEYTSVASSVVLVSTTPLWVALASQWLLKERLTTPVKWGLAVALVGGTLVGLSKVCSLGAGGVTCPPLAEFVQGRASLGNLLALLGAVFVAGYMIIGRRLRTEMSLAVYTATVYASAAIFLDVLMLFSGKPLAGFPVETYVWFLLLALLPQILGHSTFNYALGYLPAAYVSIASLGEPVSTTLLALVILGETPLPIEVMGGLITLAGIYITSRGPTSD